MSPSGELGNSPTCENSGIPTNTDKTTSLSHALTANIFDIGKVCCTHTYGDLVGDLTSFCRYTTWSGNASSTAPDDEINNQLNSDLRTVFTA